MAISPELDPAALRLQPFDPATAPSPLQLGASLRRHGSQLEIRWRLQGDLARLRLPEPAPEPQRRDELWTSTCLECFLARPGETGYWELNLCPSGHWNLYRLEGYRQGLRPEPAIQALRADRQIGEQAAAEADAGQQPTTLELALALDLEALLGAEACVSPLELGVTAVVETSDGAISYWALAHPAAEADFHHRDGFCLTLPAAPRQDHQG